MTCFLEFPKLQTSAASYQNQNHLLVKTGFITLNPFCFSRIYCLPMEFNSSSPNTIRVVSTFASPFEGSPDQNDSSNSSSSRKPLSLWPGMYHSPVTNALWETRSKVFERLLDPPLDAPPQSELLKKTPAESRTSILYNFSTDYILREQYRDPWNEVRIGKLLEDLDALAGTISVKTGKAAPVNRLCPEAEAEKLLYEAAEARNNIRKRKRGEDKREIENGGVNRLEELLAEGRIFCDMPALADRDTILLRDTRLENSLICQPQQRNIHGRIFGGFLMLRAFELAFSTAYAFAGLMPSFLEVDHVNFLRPVDVGDFLRFKSCVLYTEHENTDQPLINVEVVAHVTRPEQRSSEVSNRFYFTFTVRTEAKATNSQFRIRKVVPATEEEARRVLERMDADHLQSIKYTCK
ncbi:acyl-coenzyme A thioesterase 2, chloroplastic isoform X3 [Nicotiana tabacum]|uniref:acyl-coenzyme A thioesterase 2, chloroplastic isoform X3 n=1 Tax=Nicotiana tabacum TaxID=4097 RepID=UPI003F4EECBF